MAICFRGRMGSAVLMDRRILTTCSRIFKGYAFLLFRATYPSSKGAVCKTVMHGCNSHRRLHAEMLELADNMDLKSIGPKARVGSNPTLGTMGSWRSWLARFLDMEEVRGSSPLGPTINGVMYE